MWQPHRLEREALTLVTYHAGSGPPVIWVNGGPGDDHRSLRQVAEPLTPYAHCVLYDQRGCGQSTLTPVDETTISVDAFVDDLDAIRRDLGEEQITLIGHSWGAILALIYSANHPDHVARQVLISMGPLTREAAAVNRANLRKPFNRHDRYLFDVLRGQRQVAIANGAEDQQTRLHQRIAAEYYSRAWFYSPEAARAWATDYQANYAHNPHLASLLMPQVYDMNVLSLVNGLSVPTLVIYGYQDTQPITQAYVLAEHLHYVQTTLINECGHVPWMEQPEAFYDAVFRFLDIQV